MSRLRLHPPPPSGDGEVVIVNAPQDAEFPVEGVRRLVSDGVRPPPKDEPPRRSRPAPAAAERDQVRWVRLPEPELPHLHPPHQVRRRGKCGAGIGAGVRRRGDRRPTPGAGGGRGRQYVPENLRAGRHPRSEARKIDRAAAEDGRRRLPGVSVARGGHSPSSSYAQTIRSWDEVGYIVARRAETGIGQDKTERGFSQDPRTCVHKRGQPTVQYAASIVYRKSSDCAHGLSIELGISEQWGTVYRRGMGFRK